MIEGLHSRYVYINIYIVGHFGNRYPVNYLPDGGYQQNWRCGMIWGYRRTNSEFIGCHSGTDFMNVLAWKFWTPRESRCLIVVQRGVKWPLTDMACRHWYEEVSVSVRGSLGIKWQEISTDSWSCSKAWLPPVLVFPKAHNASQWI